MTVANFWKDKDSWVDALQLDQNIRSLRPLPDARVGTLTLQRALQLPLYPGNLIRLP